MTSFVHLPPHSTATTTMAKATSTNSFLFSEEAFPQSPSATQLHPQRRSMLPLSQIYVTSEGLPSFGQHPASR